ncbi:hypothetical protein PR048_015608 [Dryococelus australis]|uniref:Uncharacterized protein n=1 Tax=Dryococelus australis TaxID=614101 RepID=A0ABQ9HHF4_9NEOP|nr:hypothetical protein PR048_015608 [Dryococelus australis]
MRHVTQLQQLLHQMIIKCLSKFYHQPMDQGIIAAKKQHHTNLVKQLIAEGSDVSSFWKMLTVFYAIHGISSSLTKQLQKRKKRIMKKFTLSADMKFKQSSSAAPENDDDTSSPTSLSQLQTLKMRPCNTSVPLTCPAYSVSPHHQAPEAINHERKRAVLPPLWACHALQTRAYKAVSSQGWELSSSVARLNTSCATTYQRLQHHLVIALTRSFTYQKTSYITKHFSCRHLLGHQSPLLAGSGALPPPLGHTPQRWDSQAKYLAKVLAEIAAWDWKPYVCGHTRQWQEGGIQPTTSGDCTVRKSGSATLAIVGFTGLPMPFNSRHGTQRAVKKAEFSTAKQVCAENLIAPPKLPVTRGRLGSPVGTYMFYSNPVRTGYEVHPVVRALVSGSDTTLGRANPHIGSWASTEWNHRYDADNYSNLTCTKTSGTLDSTPPPPCSTAMLQTKNTPPSSGQSTLPQRASVVMRHVARPTTPDYLPSRPPTRQILVSSKKVHIHSQSTRTQPLVRKPRAMSRVVRLPTTIGSIQKRLYRKVTTSSKGNGCSCLYQQVEAAAETGGTAAEGVMQALLESIWKMLMVVEVNVVSGS